jgi:hypothetical protein
MQEADVGYDEAGLDGFDYGEPVNTFEPVELDADDRDRVTLVVKTA